MILTSSGALYSLAIQWGGMKRFLLLACMLTGLAACANSNVAPETRFSSHDPDAIVVIGLNSVYKVPSMGLLKSAPDSAIASFRIRWTQWRVDNKPFVTGLGLKHISLSYEGTDLIAGATQESYTRYFVMRVAPGRYYLDEIYYFKDYGRLTHYTTKAGPNGPQFYFDAKAGEVTSIGDVWVDVKPPRAHFITRRNDAGARKALQGYPAITAPIVFRPMIRQAPENPAPDIKFK